LCSLHCTASESLILCKVFAAKERKLHKEKNLCLCAVPGGRSYCEDCCVLSRQLHLWLKSRSPWSSVVVHPWRGESRSSGRRLLRLKFFARVFVIFVCFCEIRNLKSLFQQGRALPHAEFCGQGP
jgi:hypothetical protein